MDESNRNLSLVVRRTRGKFGEVSVFCYAQNVAITQPGTYGAILGEDFQFQSQVGPPSIDFIRGRKKLEVQYILSILNPLAGKFPEDTQRK